jgi:2Fe-2S ferredoxin
MARITYINAEGEESVQEVSSGSTVMRGAVDNGVLGIIGECSGNCSCATCHVYVDEAWADKVGEQGEMEAILLEEVYEARPTSRLSCQIPVTDALDGLIVHLPERQV